ncbi:hypothetical protein [Archangium violaceum]|nr:hypothetical protein [Archangium violaceum]
MTEQQDAMERVLKALISGEALARESARRLVAAILPPRASGHRI